MSERNVYLSSHLRQCRVPLASSFQVRPASHRELLFRVERSVLPWGTSSKPAPSQPAWAMRWRGTYCPHVREGTALIGTRKQTTFISNEAPDSQTFVFIVSNSAAASVGTIVNMRGMTEATESSDRIVLNGTHLRERRKTSYYTDRIEGQNSAGVLNINI